jgi:integrase
LISVRHLLLLKRRIFHHRPLAVLHQQIIQRLDPERLNAHVVALKADRGGAAGALIKLLILSGARRNEMTELARDEITPDSIELRGDRTKNGMPHTIPITPMIRRVFNTLLSTGKFVLNGTNRPFGDHSGAKEKVTPAIPPWTLHDLRRSFASGLQRLGVAPYIVELALNHRSGTFSGVAGIYSGTVTRRKCERPPSFGRSTSTR